jgi:predicted O-methyltransferase YrrM
MARAGADSAPAASDLALLLDGIELGTWSLGPASIDELVRLVTSRRPRTIVEFGSGVSTVALAWAMRETFGPGDVTRIVSIEQDAEHAQRTRDLLARSDLATGCVIVVAPLEDQVIDGFETTCYAVRDSLRSTLGDRRADLVVIDGPAGPPGVRFGTLPLVRDHVADRATFVMDDALRDGELGIAKRWSALPYVHVVGIRLVEKGLLTGTVTGG